LNTSSSELGGYTPPASITLPDMSETFQDISPGYRSVCILILRLVQSPVGDIVSVGKVEGGEDSVGDGVGLVVGNAGSVARYVLHCASIRSNCPRENVSIHASML